VIRTPFEIDTDELRRAALKHVGPPLTGAHAAAEGSMVDSDDDPVTESQEEAGRGPGIREGVADLPKAFRDAYAPPADYPRSVAVHPEDFRRGPVRAGHEALSPGYEPPLSFPAPPPQPPAPWAYLGGGECA
jgi:hypothetical protein